MVVVETANLQADDALGLKIMQIYGEFMSEG